jgi:trehalose-phosphatase
MKQEKLWVFNFDGTLTGTRSCLHTVRLDPDCTSMLWRLVENFPGRVAVVSSRPLNNLSAKIPVHGLFLGGNRGLTWQFPEGGNKLLYSPYKNSLFKIKNALIPKIEKLVKNRNVDAEDKFCSFTLHVPHLGQQVQNEIFNFVKSWEDKHSCKVFRGHESIEITLVPKDASLAAIPHFCSLVGLEPASAEIIYAGHDKNDIPIMRWVLQHNGYVYTVGEKPLVPSSVVVKSPRCLADKIMQLCFCHNAKAFTAVA